MRYSGGEGHNMGLVKTLPQTTFDALVKEQLGHPVPLALTKDEFMALTPERQNAAKMTRYLTPGFIAGESRRNEYVETCNLVFLDIDVEYADKAKTQVLAVPAEPIMRRLADMPNILAPFNYAIYRTASSTPKLPRLRIVVDANQIPVTSYPAAVSYVARMLGLSSVTSESVRVAQAMFLPVLFRGELEHPLLATRFDGRALVLGDYDESVDLLGTPSRGNLRAPSVGIYDTFEHLRPALDEVSIADVEGALANIDPDIDRADWIQIGAGLKHQFGEEGLAIWGAWSRTGEKFEGDDKLQTQWDSLKGTPRGRAPVTVRTVLKMARANGWASDEVAQRCFQSTSTWIIDPSRSEIELMQGGVTRIAGTPLLTTVEKGVLLNKLSRALRLKDAPISRADLTKGLRKAERELRGRGGDHEGVNGTQLPEWAKGITYVAQSNEFYRQGSSQKWSVDALNNNFSMFLVAEGQDEENARPAILPQHYLLNMVKIPRVDYYLYDPTQPNEATVEIEKRFYINTYRATYPGGDAPKEAADKIGKTILDHTHMLFGDTPEARQLIDWMAFQVQNQGGRVLWAPMIQGAEGCGKTLYAVVLRLVLGEENVKEVQPNVVIHSDWNEWAANCQLVVLEEVRVVGENRHAVMNKLKPLITNTHISINQRNTDTRVVPNYANYFLTSNFADALAITENDRRYFVMFARQQTRAQVLAIGQPYFRSLYDQLRRNPQALRTWLMEWDISPSFDAMYCPTTADKSLMTEAACPPLQRAVTEMISDGDNPLVQADLVSAKVLRQMIEQESRGLGRFSDQSLTSVLREIGYESAGRTRIDGDRHSIWVKNLDHASALTLARLRADHSDLL